MPLSEMEKHQLGRWPGWSASHYARQDQISAARPSAESTSPHNAREPLEHAGESAEGWVWPAETKDGHINHDSLKLQHKKALRLAKLRAFEVSGHSPGHSDENEIPAGSGELLLNIANREG
jgi:hypothetical protein